MPERSFDRFTRRAAAVVSRRASLLALSGAMVATSLGAPGTTMARSKGRKPKSKGKSKGQRHSVCTRQVTQCQATLPNLCRAGTEKADECVALLLPCCDFFAQCDVGAAFTCASNVIAAARSG